MDEYYNLKMDEILAKIPDKTLEAWTKVFQKSRTPLTRCMPAITGNRKKVTMTTASPQRLSPPLRRRTRTLRTGTKNY